jgi:ABC-2 type transport system ATP-binding protein
VSSHLLGELEQICDWLVVINNGHRLFQGTPDELAGVERLVLRPERAQDLAALADVVEGFGLEAGIEDSHVLVPFSAARERTEEIAEIVRRAAASGITLVEVAPRLTHLEQSYLDLIRARR